MEGVAYVVLGQGGRVYGGSDKPGEALRAATHLRMALAVGRLVIDMPWH